MRYYTVADSQDQWEWCATPEVSYLSFPAQLVRFQQTGGEYRWRVVAPKKRQFPNVTGNTQGDIASNVLWSQEDRLQRSLDLDACRVEKTTVFSGHMVETEEDRVCPHCGGSMHVKDTRTKPLKTLPIGSNHALVEVDVRIYRCPHCGKTVTQEIPFESKYHRLTIQLEHYIESLLGFGYTLSRVEELVGVHRHIVKEIDTKRLHRMFTEDGKLRKPERQAQFLTIDEFKLHDGPEYATHITDLQTGYVLWIEKGKKKEIVHHFIDFVGEEWMKNVQAVSCDMNAGFANAFMERCPHLDVVFDHFHLVQNFNEMVINPVRKDEQKRLMAEGDLEAAKSLFRNKYLLMSTSDGRSKADQRAEEGKIKCKGSDLFQIAEKGYTGGQEAAYQQMIAQNELFFTCDYVKEGLRAAYEMTNRAQMKACIEDIIATCRSTENPHFERYAKLLENHLDGITAHADFPISTGRTEGINQKIKNIRRQAYGYRDDEYFFLKIMEASRRRTS